LKVGDYVIPADCKDKVVPCRVLAIEDSGNNGELQKVLIELPYFELTRYYAINELQVISSDEFFDCCFNGFSIRIQGGRELIV